MLRFLSGLFFLMAANMVLAQSIEDIDDLVKKGQWDKAKTAVDNFLSKEKNAAKSDGWWFKGIIYNEIAKSEQYKSLVADGRMDAFNAFKKYYEMDQKAVRATLEQHVRLFDIYNGYFDQGVADFNAQKFEEAMNNFKKALTVGEFISAKGFELVTNGVTVKIPAFDTTLVQNIALSAYRAKKEDEASIYYRKIADQKIAGKDNVDVYQLLIEYYTKKNDSENKEKYLQLGRELYPQDDRWYQMELEEVKKDDKKALFTKYDELTGKYPDKYVLFYNYGVEMFNYAYTGDNRPADYKEIQKKVEAILKKSLEINKSQTEPYVILTMHYYNMIYDLQEEQKAIKGNTLADQKKKADIKAALVTHADELLKYANGAYDVLNSKINLKGSEKANLRKVVDYMSLAYEIKGDKAKADEYKKKLETIQ
jgi:hypothetical protein